MKAYDAYVSAAPKGYEHMIGQLLTEYQVCQLVEGGRLFRIIWRHDHANGLPLTAGEFRFVARREAPVLS